MNKAAWIIVIMSIILIGCTLTTSTHGGEGEPLNQEGLHPTIVMDGLGRELSFDDLPEDIIVAGKATTLILDSLYLFPEAKTKISAIENRSQNFSLFLELVDTQYPEKMILPREVGVEELASRKPDLIVLKQSMAEKLGQPLIELGFQVFYIDMETPDAFLAEIQSLGAFLGNVKRATEISLFYQNQMIEIKNIISQIDLKEYPSVLLLQASDKEGTTSFSVPPANWLQTNMVERAGGIPVWKESMLGEGWETVTFEQIAVWNPDLIFIVNYSGDARQIVSNLYSSDLWVGLSAVTNNKLYPFGEDFVSWDQPDSRWILGLHFLAVKIHPELFEEEYLNEKIYLFFSEMYGLTSDQIDAQIMNLVQ